MSSPLSAMKKELAFGIIPLVRKGGVWNVFLVKHHSGDHWGFPKGHPDEGEAPHQTALRELKEETGLHIVRYLVEDEITEKYQFERDNNPVKKTVTYFVAEVSGDVFLQFDELCGGKWVPLFEADSHITYAAGRQACQQVHALFDRFS